MSRALEFLKTRDESKPFFLNISFARPHSPYVPPSHYFDMYYWGETPAPHVGGWAAVHDDPGEVRNRNAWRGRMTPGDIHRARSGYYGEISFIDTQVGRLLNALSKIPGGKDTWIIFTSDHGDMQGDHNLWRKTYAYEGSSGIPLIITPPGISGPRGNTTVPGVVELRDIMPTILDIAGINIPENVDGASLIPLLDGKKASVREYIHGEHCTCYSPEQEMQFVTDGKRKYIWFPRTGAEQFFDLEKDPGEVSSLIEDGARHDEIEEWRGRLARELDIRNCGWVKDGKLIRPDDKPLVSPYRDRRFR